MLTRLIVVIIPQYIQISNQNGVQSGGPPKYSPQPTVGGWRKGMIQLKILSITMTSGQLVDSCADILGRRPTDFESIQ